MTPTERAHEMWATIESKMYFRGIEVPEARRIWVEWLTMNLEAAITEAQCHGVTD